MEILRRKIIYTALIDHKKKYSLTVDSGCLTVEGFEMNGGAGQSLSVLLQKAVGVF